MRKEKHPPGVPAEATKRWRARSQKQRAEIYDGKAQRWTARPDVDPCWQGDFQHWIADGPTYRDQMFCERYGVFINPNGFTCQCCMAGQWPTVQKYRYHTLPNTEAASGASKAQDALVAGVLKGRLTETEAVALANERWAKDTE